MKLIAQLIKQHQKDLLEYYTFAMVSVGLPIVAWSYAGWQLALATFVVAQIVIGVLALRSNK